jgi:type II secretory pathway component GspD/PulD (secretin)
MTRNFCWIIAVLVIVFALSIGSWAQEKSREPDYLKEKEQMIRTEKPRPVELEKSDKSTQQYIKALAGELEELRAKLKALPPDKDDEARNYQERIAEVEKQIAQLKQEQADKLAREKVKRAEKEMPAKKLSSVEAQKRIEILKRDIEESREKIQELRRTNPDSPRLKELQEYIAEREKMIASLTAQVKKEGAPQQPKRPVEQIQLKIFTLKNIDVESAFKIVKEFITPDGRGIIVPVVHTNSLIIRDTQKNLRDIGTIIEHIDVHPVR